jgi:hypothetical protein
VEGTAEKVLITEDNKWILVCIRYFGLLVLEITPNYK